MSTLTLNPNNPDHLRAAREVLAAASAPEPDPDPALLLHVDLKPVSSRTRGLLVTQENLRAVRARVGGSSLVQNPARAFRLQTGNVATEVAPGDVVVEREGDLGWAVVYAEDIGTLWRMEPSK